MHAFIISIMHLVSFLLFIRESRNLDHRVGPIMISPRKQQTAMAELSMFISKKLIFVCILYDDKELSL